MENPGTGANALKQQEKLTETAYFVCYIPRNVRLHIVRSLLTAIVSNFRQILFKQLLPRTLILLVRATVAVLCTHHM